MDGALALTIVVILCFVIFIFWAKSATGKMTLRNSLGEPHSFRKRQRLAKRRAPSTSKTVASKTPKRPTR